ncbi:VanZ family protein [Halospeciosus flavus]|uniref:VanZ family protein n=1 Tax=Halospeciosus flavus TaxID=3032283 RepID=UPI002441A81C|nr:VanZ family protein [Halospeciosus flavus]
MAVVVFVLSAVQVGGAGSTSGSLGLVGLDKWLHAVGYAGLSFLVAAAFGRRGWRSLTAVVALVVVFGGAIELVQGALPWRSASVLDLLADAVGALVGVAAYRGWRAVRGRVRPV